MKAVQFHGTDRYQITDAPDPIVNETDVLIKVHACGLCGTDLHILKGEYPSTFPLIPGHEFSGTVTQIGSKVTNIQIGDRVCIDPNIVCHACPFCRQGKVHLCENLFPIGVKRDGGLADFVSVPQGQVYAIPTEIDLSQAAMVEPLSCALHGIDQARIQAGQRVLILGGGAIGAMLAMLARAAGASRVVVSEPKALRRKMLLELAADAVIDPTARPLPTDADVIIEAAGLAVTARQALEVAKRGATIVFFGVTAPDQKIDMVPFDVYARELTIRGSFINPFTVQRSIDLLANGRIDLRPLISHHLGLADFGDAINIFNQGDSLKIQILPDTKEKNDHVSI